MASGLERTGVDDGTFWIELVHFVMAFALVDVCFVYRSGWHSKSLPNAFCERASPWRLCRDAYIVRTSAPTRLYLMALQPTKRGAWCRNDRKKSYRLGDLSLFVAKVDANGNFVAVVGGGLAGCGTECRKAYYVDLDEPGKRYVVLAYNLGAPPTAAEVTKAQPFSVRFYSNSPIDVAPVASDSAALRSAMRALARDTLFAGFCVYENVHDETVIPSSTIRKPLRLAEDVYVLQCQSNGVVAFVALNGSAHAVQIELAVQVRSMLARTREGVLKHDAAASEQASAEQTLAAAWHCFSCKTRNGAAAKKCASCASARPVWAAAGNGFKWEAKWKAYNMIVLVPAAAAGPLHTRTGADERQSGAVRQLLLVLVSTGVQYQLGKITLRALGATGAPPPPPAGQSKLTTWLKGSSVRAATPAEDECALFGAVDLAPEQLQRIIVAAGARVQRVVQSRSDDDALQLAISHSSREVRVSFARAGVRLSFRLRFRAARSHGHG
jgi:hypothetical protein